MNIGKVKEMLDCNYATALRLEYVEDKLAWAAYQTWKQVDNNSKDERVKQKKWEREKKKGELL